MFRLQQVPRYLLKRHIHPLRRGIRSEVVGMREPRIVVVLLSRRASRGMVLIHIHQLRGINELVASRTQTPHHTISAQADQVLLCM